MNQTGHVQSTYFARDPLRSYFHEPQKNGIYFLNLNVKNYVKQRENHRHAYRTVLL